MRRSGTAPNMSLVMSAMRSGHRQIRQPVAPLHSNATAVGSSASTREVGHPGPHSRATIGSTRTRPDYRAVGEPRMVAVEQPLQQKLTLLWDNHFATINDAAMLRWIDR